MLDQITCPQCKKELKSVGGESALKAGYNEHFFCEECKVNIDVAVRFNKTEGDKNAT